MELGREYPNLSSINRKEEREFLRGWTGLWFS
jgi:hypothetical protein